MPRRTKPATVAEVNALKEPGRYSIGDSLILSVTPNGGRSWLARIRDAEGRRRDIGLGPLSDVPLAKAREKARELRNAGRDGEPILTRAERRRALRSERKAPTFREAAKSLHKERKGAWKNGKHQDQWINTLEAYAFPGLGDLRVDEIAAPEIIDAVAPIWNDKPETARRVRQRVLAVLDWAHARDYRQTQVSAEAVTMGLGPQRAQKRNFAAMPYVDVPGLVQQLRASETVGNLALEFLIYCASRSGEVRGACWSEMDESTALWTIPADRMKAGKEHVVPLSDRALEIVARMRELTTSNEYVFPIGGRVMSDATMAKALRSAGVARERGTVHGMRSSFRDWVSEETNFPGDVAEAALAHVVKNKVEAAYRRGSLLAKRREMMKAWAAYLEGRSAEVVQMREVAA